ncbi:BMP family ABC transporter substrate-binding protein [Methylobacterium symbioticum]|uniref:Purine-binding protein n=1 Tax=Methylobacterium symbioticum TaxID=2584084 RepID=A0A509E8A1_9HYPH|nr:BMP family ABC transporter substrate-binding protein [Methylobacterium symbioticum]VUD69815.1 Purine-binding protein [Methylobacterium symbioticum]
MRAQIFGAALLTLAASLSPAGADEPLKAGFLYVGPRADAGWTARHDEARRCLEAAGIKTTFVESVPEGPDTARIEQDLIGQGYKAIFATAFGYQPFTQKVAKQNPDTHFFGIAPTIAPGANIQNVYGKLWDGRYLNGIVAGRMTKTNKIGFVAAQPIPPVIAGINAFALGVRSVNPKATVSVVWTLSWFDPPAEKQAAVALVEAGNDVIAQHQDTASALQGAIEKGAFAIGSESDMSAIGGDKVLTGTVWNWCELDKRLIKSVQDKAFRPGDYYGGLDDGVVGLAKMSPLVPTEVAKLVEEKRTAIAGGTFDYWKAPLKDNKGNVVLSEGKALGLPDIQKMRWLLEGVSGAVPQK